MNDLISQLWICLAIATLLGMVIGWFIRGDKSHKLAEIENRWHKRFSDLEYTNQSLIRKLKNCMKQEQNHKALQSRLERMKKGAELSSFELNRKKTRILELESTLDGALSSLEKKSFSIKQAQDINRPSEERKKQSSYSKLRPSRRDSSESQLIELEKKYALLGSKVDEYKMSLLDAESKLQVAYERLEAQDQDIRKK